MVEVTFDPTKVSYATLVDLFFKMHNPTTLNRQGPDFGTQYRSVIFTHGPEQAKVAQERLALHLLIAAATFGALIYATVGLGERRRANTAPRGIFGPRGPCTCRPLGPRDALGAVTPKLPSTVSLFQTLFVLPTAGKSPVLVAFPVPQAAVTGQFGGRASPMVTVVASPE